MAGDSGAENKNCHVHVQVTPAQRAWLEARAAEEGRSLAAFVRRLIDHARWERVAHNS